jgi:LysR family glycine cleavage system transcriptional activator
VDVAVRFGYGPDPPELYSEKLLDDWVTPVMTPELAAKYPTIESLATIPLIHAGDITFLDPPADWPAWFKAVGLPDRDWTGQRFSHADHTIDAALTGAGAVMARISFAGRLLRDGRLVAPFRPALKTIAHFRFVCVKGTETLPNIRAFRNWLFDQVAITANHEADHDLIDPRDVGKP